MYAFDSSDLNLYELPAAKASRFHTTHSRSNKNHGSSGRGTASPKHASSMKQSAQARPKPPAQGEGGSGNLVQHVDALKTGQARFNPHARAVSAI